MFRVISISLVFCLVSWTGQAADDLWEWVTPLPQGHDLFAAEVNHDVKVVVGREGTVIASVDGGDWRVVRAGNAEFLLDVEWANGLFVAVGSYGGQEFNPGTSVILTSVDGVDWIERYRDDFLSLEDVVWTGTRFVAAGTGHKVVVSPDGLVWTEQDLEIDRSWTITGLAWNGTVLAAVGYDNVFWAGFPSFFSSEDGDEWQVTNFECDHCQPTSIAAVDGRFAAVGSSGKVLVSEDGLNWDEIQVDPAADLDIVVEAGHEFFAIGHQVSARSFDGYAWTFEELSTESQVYGLAWTGDEYLAFGEDGFLMSSPDGLQWNQLSSKSFEPTHSWEINELASNGSTVVGVGQVVVTGRHGTEWARRYVQGDTILEGVVWDGSSFLAAGRRAIVQSIDGVHWTQVYEDPDLDLFDIGWNGSSYVAVGRWQSWDEIHRIILTSPDGRAWTSHEFDFDGNLFTVGWAGSRWVAVGSGEWMFTSGDGTTWQPQALDEGLEIKDMASNGDRLVAVGHRQGSGGLVLATDDGISWFEAALPEIPTSSFDDVAWTGTHFVAVSGSTGDYVFSSEDGLSWTVETTGTGVRPLSVVGDDRNLYVTGRGLKIIRRTEPLQAPAQPRRPTGRTLPEIHSSKTSLRPWASKR